MAVPRIYLLLLLNLLLLQELSLLKRTYFVMLLLPPLLLLLEMLVPELLLIYTLLMAAQQLKYQGHSQVFLLGHLLLLLLMIMAVPRIYRLQLLSLQLLLVLSLHKQMWTVMETRQALLLLPLMLVPERFLIYTLLTEVRQLKYQGHSQVFLLER